MGERQKKIRISIVTRVDGKDTLKDRNPQKTVSRERQRRRDVGTM